MPRRNRRPKGPRLPTRPATHPDGRFAWVPPDPIPTARPSREAYSAARAHDRAGSDWSFPLVAGFPPRGRPRRRGRSLPSPSPGRSSLVRRLALASDGARTRRAEPLLIAPDCVAVPDQPTGPLYGLGHEPARGLLPANDGNQRLAATRDPRHPIPSRVRCLASLGAFSLLLSADPVLLHDVRTLLDDAGEIALVYLKLESVCLE